MYDLCKALIMQNTTIPASFLSLPLGKEITQIKSGNHLLVIREEGSAEKISRLYCLFFGTTKSKSLKVKTELVQAEPDYYSSYE